jgi:hypothetical protein
LFINHAVNPDIEMPPTVSAVPLNGENNMLPLIRKLFGPSQPSGATGLAKARIPTRTSAE